MLAVVLLILLDVPRPSHRDWFDLRRAVHFIWSSHLVF